jgi:hypothetical protein
MQVSDVYVELFGRIPEIARNAVDGLTPDQLVIQFEADTNPIGWLVWHLTRVQDHHVAELLDEPQLWETGDWPGRFGVEADPADVGYGHTPAQVATVRPQSSAALVEYLEAVHARTGRLLGGLTAEELDRVVDRRWDPPVTLGVRLVSVADDCLQHAGQAAYLRGLLGW